MSESQKDRYIDYLADRVTNLDLDKRAMELVLEDFLKAQQSRLDEETRKRKIALHFGSDEGVEMAATYHSIISTVKLHGKSAWNCLGTFFQKIFNGYRDFICLTPGNIKMAVCQ